MLNVESISAYPWQKEVIMPVGFASKLLSRDEHHSISYHSALQLIVKQGGDADTKAAVVAAISGSYYGYDKIRNTASCKHDAWLKTEINNFLNAISPTQ